MRCCKQRPEGVDQQGLCCRLMGTALRSNLPDLREALGISYLYWVSRTAKYAWNIEPSWTGRSMCKAQESIALTVQMMPQKY